MEIVVPKVSEEIVPFQKEFPT